MPSKRSVGGARGWIDRLELNPAGGNRAGKATASIGALASERGGRRRGESRNPTVTSS
jgi:hypothetical protein